MNEKKYLIKSKKQMFLVIGVFALILLLGTTSYAFFNYTRAGSDNSIGTGRINFVSTQSGTTSISNYFPQIPGGAAAEQSSTATITVTGGTTFSGGIKYYVKLIDVKVGNNAYNPETDVPVKIDVAEVSGLTVANRGTFTPEGNNHSGVGIALSEGVIIANGTIGVADTAANSDNWINGTFTVQAYIPSNVAISDTTGEYSTTEYVNGTTTTWVAGRRVLTTEQWNALSANPVTFKIQVVANEGKLPNTMSLSSNSGTIYVGASETVTINTTGDGTKTCSTSDNTKATCSISGNTLTINGVAAGTATITVNQASSAGYTAASATYTATIALPPTLYELVSSSSQGQMNSSTDFGTVASSDTTNHLYGVYQLVENNTNSVYFFRGDHTVNNNVIFDNKCWLVVRTTETNSTRMIYNGTPTDGHCTTTEGNDTMISLYQSDSTNSAGNYDYSTTEQSGYTLKTGTNFKYNVNYNNAKYVGYTYDNGVNSNMKNALEAWYEGAISSNAKAKIETSTYCNDIRVDESVTSSTQYMPRTRAQANTPSVLCPTGANLVSSKVGFLTVDEVILAGRTCSSGMQDYLYNNSKWWLGSPYYFISGSAYVFGVFYANNAYINSSVNNVSGLRPVVSISSNTRTTGAGDGSQLTPWIIS